MLERSTNADKPAGQRRCSNSVGSWKRNCHQLPAWIRHPGASQQDTRQESPPKATHLRRGVTEQQPSQRAGKQLIKQTSRQVWLFSNYLQCSQGSPLTPGENSSQGKMGNLKISAFKQEAGCWASISYEKNFTHLPEQQHSLIYRQKDWLTVNCSYFFKTVFSELIFGGKETPDHLFNSCTGNSKKNTPLFV